MHKEMHVHAEKQSFTSAVLRNGQWQLTTDPLQCAEVFGQLHGVISAKSLIADASSVEAAMAILDGLERRYAAQADGRLEELEPPPSSGHLLLRLTY